MKRFTSNLKRMVWLMLMLVCVQGTTVAQKVGDTFTADKLKYRVLNEQEVEVVRHIDKNYATGEVIIPETVVAAKWNRNYTVTTIGEVAFAYCSGLRAINIPNSVTTIESEAFCGCSGLTSINIPNSVTTIEYQTFSGCSGLTAINIPNSITTIGNDAFTLCNRLKTLYFHSINPPTVTGDDLGYDFHPETIYVPQEAVATYQTTEPYYRYNIQGMDETAGIGEVETTEAPQSGNIYDLNGRLVRTDGNLQALPKGIYILNVKKMVR